MSRLRRWLVPAALSLGAVLAVPRATALGDDPLPTWPPPQAQPDAGPKETTAQLCKRCKSARSACKRACAGPDGTGIPSDYCLDKCDNSYWSCIPTGHACD